MDKENFKNIITKQEMIEMIEEEVDQEIKKDGINESEMSKIAEDLKNKGEFRAGDELWEEAFRIYRKRLIDKEIEKRGEN